MITIIPISLQKSLPDICLAFRKTRTKLKLETCFLKNKQGKFFRVHNERQDSHDLFDTSTQKATFEFQIMLDSEEKHHSAKIYGFIDAIGTLGGVHEILLWCIMLIYGSLRKNVCLFSIINRLIQTEQLQDTTNEENNERRQNNQILTFIPNQTSRENSNRHTNNQHHNYTPILRSENEMRPGIF